jgi:hypothetical protein
MYQNDRQTLRNAAILQVIAGELHADNGLDHDRLAELARALNVVASTMLAGQARSLYA